MASTVRVDDAQAVRPLADELSAVVCRRDERPGLLVELQVAELHALIVLDHGHAARRRRRRDLVAVLEPQALALGRSKADVEDDLEAAHAAIVPARGRRELRRGVGIAGLEPCARRIGQRAPGERHIGRHRELRPPDAGRLADGNGLGRRRDGVRREHERERGAAPGAGHSRTRMRWFSLSVTYMRPPRKHTPCGLAMAHAIGSPSGPSPR